MMFFGLDNNVNTLLSASPRDRHVLMIIIIIVVVVISSSFSARFVQPTVKFILNLSIPGKAISIFPCGYSI